MPRTARLAAADIPWHIVQRGNNRNNCFFRESDYLYYLTTLSEQAQEHGCKVHAYCLMTNHVHILLTPDSERGPSLLMKNLGQRYVQYINAIYERSGTLWEGRFKSCLAQDEHYALCCYRYIELNPVRAGLVSSPGNYPWSSFCNNALGVSSNLLVPHYTYEALGKSTIERCQNYRALIEDHMQQSIISEIRTATGGNHAVGSKKFKSELTLRLGKRVERGVPGRPSID